MKYKGSLVIVKNIEKSRGFYENLLDQKVKIDLGETLVFEGGFALHQRNYSNDLVDNVFLNQDDKNFELYFENDGLDLLVKKLTEKNIELVHQVKKKSCEQRFIRFFDYDKNIIKVSESMEYVAFRLYKEGYSLDEISLITYMPNHLINKFIYKYSKNVSKKFNVIK